MSGKAKPKEDKVMKVGLAGMGLLLALVVAAIAYTSLRPGGRIETVGGSVCEWRTEGDITQERSLVLTCRCPGGASYACKYVGKPDLTCPPFWRDFFNFFKQLRRAIAGIYVVRLPILSVHIL